MEEYSQHQKENYAPRHQQPQKVATILRSRSCRDREVLSMYCRIFIAILINYFIMQISVLITSVKSAERRQQNLLIIIYIRIIAKSKARSLNAIIVLSVQLILCNCKMNEKEIPQVTSKT